MSNPDSAGLTATRRWPWTLSGQARERIRTGVLARVTRRAGSITPPLDLAYRQIFILPTRFGYGFAFLLLITLLGGLNFNNNMALLLAFLLGAAVLLSNLLTYRALAGLRVEAVQAEPVFAGEDAQFRVFLADPEGRSRQALQAALALDAAQDCTDLQAGQRAALVVRVPTRSRGWLAAPPIRLETRHPFGVFRAWSWVTPESRCLVYPAPAPNPPPLPRTGAGLTGEPQAGEGEQLRGLRNYRPGDPMKRIAWRASARHDLLLAREHETPRAAACVLDWHLLESVALEQRLSILAAWVIRADHHQLDYSLALPGLVLGPASGIPHRARCLQALALFGS